MMMIYEICDEVGGWWVVTWLYSRFLLQWKDSQPYIQMWRGRVHLQKRIIRKEGAVDRSPLYPVNVPSRLYHLEVVCLSERATVASTPPPPFSHLMLHLPTHTDPCEEKRSPFFFFLSYALVEQLHFHSSSSSSSSSSMLSLIARYHSVNNNHFTFEELFTCPHLSL